MEILAAFGAGAVAGGFAVALFYRKAALDLESLKRDLEAKVRSL